MTPHTSEQILAADNLYDLQESVSSGIPINYQLTDGELGWLDFVRGRYSIADYIDSNMENDILTINDYTELSQALDDDCDGFGKAVCLSDDTALQKIFFWLYTESEIEELSESESEELYNCMDSDHEPIDDKYR